MQHTSCTEDRIQHALNMCLDGLRQRPASAAIWNGELQQQSPLISVFRGQSANLLFLGMKKTVAFSELTPPQTAPEADRPEPKAPVSAQLQCSAAASAYKRLVFGSHGEGVCKRWRKLCE